MYVKDVANQIFGCSMEGKRAVGERKKSEEGSADSLGGAALD